MKNAQLEIIADEWSRIASGTKTVPLVQLGTSDSDIAKERKVFKYCANILSKMLNSPDDKGNN